MNSDSSSRVTKSTDWQKKNLFQSSDMRFHCPESLPLNVLSLGEIYTAVGDENCCGRFERSGKKD